jgi:hypothetical protein
VADMPGSTAFPVIETDLENLQKGDVVLWGDDAFKVYVARRGTVGGTYEVLFLDGTAVAQLAPTFSFNVLDPTFTH